MRSALTGPITPLLGSLGLHCSFVLVLLLAVRHPVAKLQAYPTRPDAWAGNAVEVDAVAMPDAVSNLPSDPPPAAETEAAEQAAAKSLADTPAFVSEPSQPPKPAIRTMPKQPRAPRSAKVESPSSADAPATPEANGSGITAATPAPATGAFGGEGLPPGVRSLPSAFTRAIPPATGADPIWQTLPTGSERPFTIAIEVDADGHVSSAEILKEKAGSAPETQASHVRERVVALLGGGLFALQSNVGAGRLLLRITIALSDRAVHEDDDPAQLVERGFEPPRGAAPGRAYFTLASGRHFEAKVEVLAHP
jgi:hypothetical protein